MSTMTCWEVEDRGFPVEGLSSIQMLGKEYTAPGCS